MRQLRTIDNPIRLDQVVEIGKFLIKKKGAKNSLIDHETPELKADG
jgi:hypothetical protein